MPFVTIQTIRELDDYLATMSRNIFVFIAAAFSASANSIKVNAAATTNANYSDVPSSDDINGIKCNEFETRLYQFPSEAASHRSRNDTRRTADGYVHDSDNVGSGSFSVIFCSTSNGYRCITTNFKHVADR